ncbi:predicted protein [Chaetoceros tenuissimus]|uniref:Uncharacterized protein n=1 Tax=Chaetoceros tenuissimus TaxID=426638 RepID=A0AAD3HFY9_9STRA|nr:predicted protein [Chaetoceros tenuissimus]
MRKYRIHFVDRLVDLIKNLPRKERKIHQKMRNCCFLEREDPDEAEPSLEKEGKEDIVKFQTDSNQAYNQNSVPTETIPFSKNGIKLSYLLNEFVKECGG